MEPLRHLKKKQCTVVFQSFYAISATLRSNGGRHADLREGVLQEGGENEYFGLTQ